MTNGTDWQIVYRKKNSSDKSHYFLRNISNDHISRAMNDWWTTANDGWVIEI